MNYFIKRISIGLTCFWAVILSAEAATKYVSDLTGNDTNSGTSWAVPYKTIQKGLDNVVAGDTVWVSNGTYTLTAQISITKSNTLQSVNGRDYTFINGNYPTTTNRCINIQSAGSGAVVDGFTITNGFVSTNSPNDSNGGGGINCVLATNVVIKNCTISKNISNHASGYGPDGGGIWAISLTSCTMSNCIISYNSNIRVRGHGGGIGALSSLLVVNCEIVGNTSPNGGGVGDAWGQLVLRNCLVSRNSVSGNGGGINISGGNNNTNYLDGCTIVSNYAGSGGGGFYFIGQTNNHFYNSIIYSNRNASGQSDIATNAGTISNYFYYSSTSSTNGLTVYNCITNNPMFAEFSSGNYRLLNNSPGINTGTNQAWMNGAVDLDGRQRIDRFGGRVDMGAYEFTPSGTMIMGR